MTDLEILQEINERGIVAVLTECIAEAQLGADEIIQRICDLEQQRELTEDEKKESMSAVIAHGRNIFILRNALEAAKSFEKISETGDRTVQ